MPTTAPASETTRTVDERFLDLIYGDPDLLAAEFDAIIAAEWPEPRVGRPGRSPAGRHPGRRPARRAAGPVQGLASRPRHPGIGGWARQRSPPLATPDARQAGRQVVATPEPTRAR
jgi:hypothetical protein